MNSTRPLVPLDVTAQKPLARASGFWIWTTIFCRDAVGICVAGSGLVVTEIDCGNGYLGFSGRCGVRF